MYTLACGNKSKNSFFFHYIIKSRRKLNHSSQIAKRKHFCNGSTAKTMINRLIIFEHRKKDLMFRSHAIYDLARLLALIV